MAIRITLIDGHGLFRQGLRALFLTQSDFAVVADTGDGRVGYEQLLSLQPDIVIMELLLPGLDGIQVAERMKQRIPSVRIVVLTSLSADEHLRKALTAGVDGYLLKDAAYDELIIALRCVMVGRKYISPAVSSHLVDSFLNPGRSAPGGSPLNWLTTRERSVLQLIVEGRSNRTAAEHLNVSTKTVEKHRANLMRKLGLRNSSELVLAAIDLGLIQRPSTVSRLVTSGLA